MKRIPFVICLLLYSNNYLKTASAFPLRVQDDYLLINLDSETDSNGIFDRAIMKIKKDEADK